MLKPKSWDVFISYASEDENFVKPLADFLTKSGVKVWFAPLALRVGDSLSRAIDQGLATTRFGVLVISKAFLGKAWPEYELKGLIAKEIGAEKVILPIWHGVVRDDVLNYSPTLADKVAWNSDVGIAKLAYELIELTRPDLLSRLHRRIAFRLANAQVEPKMIEVESLVFGALAPVHEELPAELVSRIRLVRAALLLAYPHSMAFWIDGFRRDGFPTNAVRFWEHLAACFLECILAWPMTSGQRRDSWWAIFALASGRPPEAVETYLKHLSPAQKKTLLQSVESQFPHLDLDDLNDSFPAREEANPHPLPAGFDRENFPVDFPDLIVEQFIQDRYEVARRRRKSKTSSAGSSSRNRTGRKE